MNKRKPILYEYLLLLFIVLVGSILRFWDYGNIPFMHDELSALSRLQFNNFNDLIREGVMLGDTHPAGVQVFLYYWTALVGTSEIMVKLPLLIQLSGGMIIINYPLSKTIHTVEFILVILLFRMVCQGLIIMVAMVILRRIPFI